jgi:hypothetical protein
MTNYHLTPPAMVPLLAVHEAKEKRRKVLEAVRERRKQLYEFLLKDAIASRKPNYTL